MLQKGERIASVLASNANKALPFAKTVGSRLLSETANLAGDLLSEENFADSAKKRLVSARRGIVAYFTTGRTRKAPSQPPGSKMNGKISPKKEGTARARRGYF